MFVCVDVCMCTVQFRLIDEQWTQRKGRMQEMSGEKRRRSERMKKRELEYPQVTGDTFNDGVILVCLTLLRGGGSCV